MKLRYSLNKIIGLIFMIICAFVILAPFTYILYRSFEVDGFFTINGYTNYIKIFTSKLARIEINFINSLYVSVITVTLVIAVTSLAAYSFSKLSFKGKNHLYIILLMGMMIPAASIILPLFQITKISGLQNNTFSLIGPYTIFSAMFNLIVLKNFYDTLPNQLFESAWIDGCNSFKSFVKIVLPLSKPAFMAVIIFSFLNSWNEFMMAFIFISDFDKSTMALLPIKLFYAFATGGKDGQVFAAYFVVVFPVILVYIILQKQFIYGITGGAVKG